MAASTYTSQNVMSMTRYNSMAVERDLSGRVAELATKSTSGMLSQDEQAKYEQIVLLNDRLSILKLQVEEYWAPHITS